MNLFTPITKPEPQLPLDHTVSAGSLARMPHVRWSPKMVIAGCVLLFVPLAQALPKIKVLATGGTIAGAQATTADAGYKSGSFSVDDLIKAVPQLKDIAELSGE